MYSLLQRLRSLRHRFWYAVSERVRWSRGAFFETPACRLPALTLEQGQRITALQRRYQVNFEQRMTAVTAVNNYEYLDILDQAWSATGQPTPSGGVLCDAGCASFWYAATLHAFFRPRELIGVEVEGYRLFKDGRTRSDYAAGYVAHLPNTRFMVCDYANCELPADVVTAWFPFVTPAAILAWRLPLSLLRPQAFFQRVYHNLRPTGRFMMVNHGEAEARVAERLCIAAGLCFVSRTICSGVLRRGRLEPAVVSCWTRS